MEKYIMGKTVAIDNDSHMLIRKYSYESGMSISGIINTILWRAIDVGLDQVVPVCVVDDSNSNND